MTTKRKQGPKGHSVFWRPEKKCYVLGYAGPTGWAQKLVPRDVAGKNQKAAATAWALTWLTERVSRGLEPKRRGEGIKVKHAYPLWQKIRRADERLAPSTIKDNFSAFNAHVLPAFEDREVADVATDFASLRKWFREICKGRSPSRARNIFSALRLFFDDAIVENWYRGTNPLRNDAMVRELPALPTADERGGIIWLQPEDVQKLLDAPDETIPLGRRVRTVSGFTSGNREGELAGRTWGDLSLDAAVPMVTVTVARRSVRAKAERLGKLKTRTSRRTIPLHPAAAAALREWRDSPDGVTFLLMRPPLSTDPVFPSERRREAGFARPRSADKLRADLEAVGLPSKMKGRNITMQASRRSFSTWLDRLKVREVVRKRLMGHGSLGVTDEHYTDADIAEMAEAIAGIPLTWRGTNSTVPGRVTLGTVDNTNAEIPKPLRGGGEIRTPGQLAPSAVFKTEGETNHTVPAQHQSPEDEASGPPSDNGAHTGDGIASTPIANTGTKSCGCRSPREFQIVKGRVVQTGGPVLARGAA